VEAKLPPRASLLSGIVIHTLRPQPYPAVCTLYELRRVALEFIISSIYCIQLLKMDPADVGQLFVLNS
jgi:hypothetical protein